MKKVILSICIIIVLVLVWKIFPVATCYYTPVLSDNLKPGKDQDIHHRTFDSCFKEMLYYDFNIKSDISFPPKL